MGIQTEVVRTDAFEMEYFKFGAGEKPLVMLPGLSITPIAQLADAVAISYGMFAGDYTVYVFDRRTDPPAEFDVRRMAGDAVDALDALGISGAYVIGVSMGSMMTQVMAVERPDLVKKAALVASSARIGEEAVAVLDEWADLALRGDLDALVDKFASYVYSPEFYARHQRALRELLGSATGHDLERFATFARGARGFDMTGELQKVGCPVLVLGATDDRVLGGEASRDLAERLGCGLQMYEGASHGFYDEVPGYRARVLEFFDE